MAFVHKAGSVPTGYGGGDHWLVHADVADWMTTLEKVQAGDGQAMAAWSAFRAAAPEMERLAWEYWDRDYGQVQTLLKGRAPAARDDDDTAELRRMAASGDPALRDWATRRLDAR
jgi:hypothetical protein